MSESTLVICGGCGIGHFMVSVQGDHFFCTVCPSEVTWEDFEGNGSEGESLVVGEDGLLHVVTEDGE